VSPTPKRSTRHGGAKLEAAAVAEAAARREFEALHSATIVRERRAMQQEVDGPPDSNFPMVEMAGVALVNRGATGELNVAEDRWRQARVRLQRLRAWPDALAAQQERERGKRYVAGPEPASRPRTIVARVSRGRIER
jgi:hypothetical protein